MSVPIETGPVAVKHLLRDRDGKFGAGFDAVWKEQALCERPYGAPNANAVAERWVRTVRSECTDSLLLLNERHLRRVLIRYMPRCNEHRPHRAMTLRPP